MKRNILSFVLLLTSITIYAQQLPSWTKTYNGAASADDNPIKMATDNSGNHYVVGVADYSDSGYNDIFLVKFNSSGTRQWVKMYADTNGYSDQAFDIAIDNAGDVILVGYAYSTITDNDILILKYDLNGNLVWGQKYDGASSANDEAHAVAIDNSNNIFVTGYSHILSNYEDIICAKFNSNGILQWAKTFNGTGDYSDEGNDIVVDNSGNCFITGIIDDTTGSMGNGTSDNIITLKYTSAGSLSWHKIAYGDGDYEDEGNAITLDTTGNVFVTGYVYNTTSYYDVVAIKYDSSGTQQWLSLYDTLNDNDRGNAITTDDSANVYVGGYYADNNGYYDMAAIKFKPNGSLAWASSVDGTAQYYDEARDIELDLNGNVIILGYANNSSESKDISVAKFSPNGALLFNKSIAGSDTDNDEALSVDVDVNGNITIVGKIDTDTSSVDVIIAQYDETGNQQWTGYYSNSGNFTDKVEAVVTDSLGNVYIAATATIKNTWDIVVVKYDNAGNVVWEQSYNSPANDTDVPKKIGLDKNGNVIVAGEISNVNDQDVVVLKYDNNGTPLWQKIFNGTASYDDYVGDMAVYKDGQIAVAGLFVNTGTGYDFTTLLLNANGDTIWTKKKLGTITVQDDFANAICFDKQGNIYVTGTVFNNTTLYDVYTVKYDSLGVQQWQNIYNNTGYDDYDEATTITVDAAGNTIVGGYSYGNGTDADFLVVKYGTTGNFMWKKTYNGLANSDDYANSVISDNAGNIYACGNIIVSGTQKSMYLAKYNTAGTLQWSKTIDGGGTSNDDAIKVLIDKYNHVHLGGTLDSPGSNDFAWIVYDQSGNLINESYFEGNYYGDDDAYAMTIDQDGGVYIGGEAYMQGYYTDATLVKYCPIIDSTIYATGNTTFCQGSSVILSAAINASSYSWSESSTTASINATTQNGFYFAATLANGCAVTSDTISTTVLPTPTATVTASGPLAYCSNDTTTLTATNVSGATYSWSNGATNASINITTSGNYYVIVTGNNGCKDTSATSVLQVSQVPTIPICLVTVNDASDANVIVWEKPVAGGAAIDSIRIYREVTTNNFTHIASVDGAELSEYTDTTADPNVTRYRYAIAVVDSCGGVSPLSAAHATIHLQYLGSGNMQWTQYEGQLVTNYNILRDDNQSGTFSSISATIPQSNTTFTDINYNNYPNAVYRLEVIWGVSCVSTQKMMGSWNTSKSNIKNLSVGVDQLAFEKNTTLFPNPAQGSVMLKVPEGVSEYQVRIVNLLAEEMLLANYTDSNIQTIDVTSLSTGIYNIIIRSGNVQSVKKLIIQ